MTKEELIAKLQDLQGDTESNHVEADALLLKFINDPEITKAFCKIDKWYA